MGCTKITEPMTINGAGKDIVLDGFDFTENGFVKIVDANSVEIRNCRIYNINVENAKKNYWLRVDSSAPLKLIVEHCYFGDTIGTNGAMYNLIEPHVVLADGSSFSSNYFTKQCCTHNTVNLYGVAEDAQIVVSNNVFEISAGTVRVGVKGQPTCSIVMNNNVVKKHNDAYTLDDAGLVTIQPFNKETVTFANMIISMNNNRVPTEQVIYGYSGAKDTELTEENMPAIYVNGEILIANIYH